MTESKLLAQLRYDARRIAKRFKLKYLAIQTEGPRVRSRYGSCDQDRVIRLRLQQTRSGRFYSYPFLIHTLCHELAHLRFMNHGNKFKKLNNEILSWARDRGIYAR